jgi:hypothetical protein
MSTLGIVVRSNARMHSVAVSGHHFQAIRPGIHMAVTANLVAPLTHINLKDFNPGGGQRTESVFPQEVIE